MSLRWWVTRPEPQASQWAQHLQQAGVNAMALPLLCIGQGPDAQAVQTEVQALHAGERDAVMFVSVNAASGLLQNRPDLAARFGEHLRAWTAGPGTARALRELGVPAHAIDQPAADSAQFDSEALWQVVQQRVGVAYRVSFMRGAEENGHVAGRDWLSDRVQAMGAQVTQVAVYTRQMPQGLAQQLADQALSGPSAWLFSSSHAVQNLQQAAPSANWQAHQALCTHERIGETARQLGFGAVRLCRPRLNEVCKSIKSWA